MVIEVPLTNYEETICHTICHTICQLNKMEMILCVKPQTGILNLKSKLLKKRTYLFSNKCLVS